MKNRLSLIGSLALAGVMLLAGPVLAQGPGAGPSGAAPQGNQVCTGGPGGVCVINPAAPSQTGKGKATTRRQRGPKGAGPGGGMNQSAPQNPAPESGK